MEELLPCPFCGEIPDFIYRQDMYEDICAYDVCCKTIDCYLEHGSDWYLTKTEAIELWNTRKPVP